MKWVMMAAVMALAIQSTRADVTDSNVLDYLLVEKTKAQALALMVKTAFDRSRPEYTTARQKYTAAQLAFNNYTMAMLSNYKAGKRMDLQESAQLATSRSKDLENYVSNLNLPSKGFSAIFVSAGILVDIGEKLFTYIQQKRQDDRAKIADAIAVQVTWDDWDKIGAW
jgi:hypothetical protein